MLSRLADHHHHDHAHDEEPRAHVRDVFGDLLEDFDDGGDDDDKDEDSKGDASDLSIQGTKIPISFSAGPVDEKKLVRARTHC